MDKGLFQIEFLGGPADGLCVRAGAVPRRTVLLPAGGATSRGPKSDGVSAARRALYKLAVGRYDLDAENGPIVRLRYEFIEVHSPERRSRIRQFAARLWIALSLRRCGGLTSNFQEKFRSWMLAPIDYPFRISPSARPTTRDVRQTT
jgi:hypothetical protein